MQNNQRRRPAMIAARGRPTPRPIFAPSDRPPLPEESSEVSELSVGADDADVSSLTEISVDDSVELEIVVSTDVSRLVSSVMVVLDSLSSVVSGS
jgi:hypothetical protein